MPTLILFDGPHLENGQPPYRNLFLRMTAPQDGSTARFTVGRGNGTSMSIDADPSVSRRHLEVRVCRDKVEVRNIGRYGTQLLTSPPTNLPDDVFVELENLDELLLGASKMLFVTETIPSDPDGCVAAARRAMAKRNAQTWRRRAGRRTTTIRGTSRR